MREGMAGRGCSGTARVTNHTGFQARTRRARERERLLSAPLCGRVTVRRVAESPSRLSAKHSFSGTPVTSIATLLLRNSSPRAFQRYPTHLLTPTGCHNQHFPCGTGWPRPWPEPGGESKLDPVIVNWQASQLIWQTASWKLWILLYIVAVQQYLEREDTSAQPWNRSHGTQHTNVQFKQLQIANCNA